MNNYYYYQQQQQYHQQPNSLLSSVNQAIFNHQQHTQHQYQQQQQPQQPQQQYQYHFQQPYYPYPTVTPPTTSQGYSLSPTAYLPQQYPQYPNNQPYHQYQHQQTFHHQNKRPKTTHNHSEKFRCEQCKQDYYNLTDLSVHLRNHVKCDYENCKFEALPDILDLHKEDRHLIFKPGREPKPKSNPKPDGPLNATIQGLGYALKTQEQIDNWIQERKKKWPTKAVVAQKLAQAEERKKRILQETANNYKNHHQNRRHVWVRNDQSGSAQASHQKSTEPVGHGAQEQDGHEGSSGSDIDPVKDSVSSKIVPPVSHQSPSPNLGQNKDNWTSRRPDHLNRPPPKQARKGSSHNRRDGNSSSTHSFLDRSGLFSKLIEKDVQQDVSDIHEVIQFLSRNNFLEGFHLKIDHPLDASPRIEEVLP